MGVTSSPHYQGCGGGKRGASRGTNGAISRARPQFSGSLRSTNRRNIYVGGEASGERVPCMNSNDLTIGGRYSRR